MAQDSAFLLDFNLVFGYGLIFFTSSVNLIVSVNFSVNFADTFQLILFIDYDIGIDHIERTKSADAAFLGEDPDIVDAVKPEKSNFIVRGIDTLKCQNVIFLKYRLIAVDQNLKAEVAVFGNMRSAHPDCLSCILKKKAGMDFADTGTVKRKTDIFALVHALIFFVNDQADQTFAIFRELAVF